MVLRHSVPMLGPWEAIWGEEEAGKTLAFRPVWPNTDSSVATAPPSLICKMSYRCGRCLMVAWACPSGPEAVLAFLCNPIAQAGPTLLLSDSPSVSSP